MQSVGINFEVPAGIRDTFYIQTVQYNVALQDHKNNQAE